LILRITAGKLSIAGNYELTGTIPTELFLLTNMTELFLSFTLLTGTLPKKISQLSKLEVLDLNQAAISGTIPEELYAAGMDHLWFLDLAGNQFSGTISTNVGRLRSMTYLYFRENPNLVGTIPSEIGLLTALQRIHVHRSNFTGSIPDELCELKYKYLDVLNADCLVDSATGEIPTVCAESCCTKCCDRETGICEKLTGA